MEKIIQLMARQAHVSWAGWTKYLFSKCKANEDGTLTIPKWAVDRWNRQIDTAYADLSQEEQNSDIHEALAYLSIPEVNEAIVFHQRRHEFLDWLSKNYAICEYLTRDCEHLIAGFFSLEDAHNFHSNEQVLALWQETISKQS